MNYCVCVAEPVFLSVGLGKPDLPWAVPAGCTTPPRHTPSPPNHASPPLCPPPPAGPNNAWLEQVIKTDTCSFSEMKIYPGHGSRYVRRDGQVRVLTGPCPLVPSVLWVRAGGGCGGTASFF